jgi:hypothetical protein
MAKKKSKSQQRPPRPSSGAPPYIVRYLPEAREERREIKDSKERKAIDRAVDKLEQLGPDLIQPHQRNVEGSTESLRELRPRRGSSQWRPLYWRHDEKTFIIGAVAPEVDTNKRGYNLGIRHAEERKGQFEAELEEENEQ